MNEQLIARARQEADFLAGTNASFAPHLALLLRDLANALEAQSVPPREPTPEMLRIGDQVLGYSELNGEAAMREAWQAMYDAAPKGQP